MRSTTPTIHCDIEECDGWDIDWYQCDADEVAGAKIKRSTSAPGWLCTDTQDLCPKHAASLRCAHCQQPIIWDPHLASVHASGERKGRYRCNPHYSHPLCGYGAHPVGTPCVSPCLGKHRPDPKITNETSGARA